MPTAAPPIEGADAKVNGVYAMLMSRLRETYRARGARMDWWWIQDDVVELVAKQLQRCNYAFVDDFLLPEAVTALKRETEAAKAAGELQPGQLVNGRKEQAGEEARYLETLTRGEGGDKCRICPSHEKFHTVVLNGGR